MFCNKCKKTSGPEIMDTVDALYKAKHEGISLAISRYTPEPKSRVQYYFNSEGVFVSQDGVEKPGTAKLSLTEKWEEYTGNYARYEKIVQRDKERFDELKLKLEPFISEYNEYIKLKNKLDFKYDYER